jgi:hypothetical protein
MPFLTSSDRSPEASLENAARLRMCFDSSHCSAAAHVLINHIQFKVGRECLLNYLSLAQKRISLDSIKGLLESRESVCSGDVTVICVCKGGVVGRCHQ